MAKPVGPRFRQPLRKWNSGLENFAPVSRLPFVRINRPFPSSITHFQSEAKCEAIDMKMIFNYDANKTHFHNKGFALSLVLQSEISWNSEMAYSVYRKTTAKAWNWHQRWLWRNWTRSSVWNIPSGKTGLPLQMFRSSWKFSAETTKKVMFHLLSNRIFQNLFVNGK